MPPFLGNIADVMKGAQNIAEEFRVLKLEVQALRTEQAALHETLRRIEQWLAQSSSQVKAA